LLFWFLPVAVSSFGCSFLFPRSEEGCAARCDGEDACLRECERGAGSGWTDTHDLPLDQSIDGAEDQDGRRSEATVGEEGRLLPCSEPLEAGTVCAGICLGTDPVAVAFGAVEYGEIHYAPLELKACGDQPVEVYGIEIEYGSSPDFGLDLSGLDHSPSTADPIVVAPGTPVVVQVAFTPSDVNALGSHGLLLLDRGKIAIKSNSELGGTEAKLSGAGVEVECPTAVIKAVEGNEVIPQTMIHFYGDESYAEFGTVSKWQWSVEQPAGSASVFVPSFAFPNPTFELNVAGVYMFYLDVFDELGTQSCQPATFEVVVIPDEAIHVELLWHTPEDLDETDVGPEAGSDLDLHFLHHWAGGPDLDGDGLADGWFDIPFDTFWFNAHPNWGSYDPGINDDPGLDRDDTDGAGPENLNLDIPENYVYRVGVHYWNDHGYGIAYASVGVYIYGQLIYSRGPIGLSDSDMWSVCTIEWPSGKVMSVNDAEGNPKITPDYQNPYFFQ